MSEFINTIDLLGDEAVTKALVERTITEFNDDAITGVGNWAFRECNKLINVSFPNVTSIGSYAFQSCSALLTADMPNVTSIGSNAFAGDNKIININFPNVTSIGESAFSNCSALLDANIPEITTLESYLFSYCGGLVMLDFPKATSIKTQSFYGCTILHTIILRSETVCTMSNINAFGGTLFASDGTGGTCLVPRALVETYKSSTNWSTLYTAGTCAFLAIEDYTVDGAINGDIDFVKLCTVKSLVEGKTIVLADEAATCIGIYAFNSATINSVFLPNVIETGSYAFEGCRKVRSINMPNLAIIGGGSFRYCDSVISLDLPNVVRIGSSAFDMCSSLTSLNLPKVAFFDTFGIGSCTALKSIRLPANPPSGTIGTKINAECVIYVPTGSLAKYQANSSWSSYTTKYTFVEEERE